MWWLLTLACSQPPCDALCRAEQAWTTAPDTLPTLIDDLEDPIERSAVVLTLAEAHPGEQATLCRKLPNGPDRQRCIRIHQRPHLRVAIPQHPRHLLGFEASSPFGGIAATPGSCGEGRGCLEAEAAVQGNAGRPETAAGFCNAIAEGTWRAECYFQAAEQAPVEAAARLCRATGPFVADCVAHLAFGVADRGPTWPSIDETDWQAVHDGALTARGALPEVGDLLAQTIWASATLRAYKGVARVTGTDAAPPAHVHAAAAWRFVELNLDRPRRLANWQAGLEAGLAERDPSPGTAASLVAASQPSLAWTPRGPESALTLVPYLGSTTLRAVSEKHDTLVCLLEALAWHKQTAPLAEAFTHEDEVVRWTAIRLAGALGQPLPDDDPSELVRGRLK